MLFGVSRDLNEVWSLLMFAIAYCSDLSDERMEICFV